MIEQSTIHATCIAWNKQGVLLRGHPGAGKSDLALRLIDSGGILVSDDQVIIINSNNRLIASPPEKLAGLLEVRGVGICTYPYLASCDVIVVLDLDNPAKPERLPDLQTQTESILAVEIACFALNPFQASAPAKVRAMLQLAQKKQLLA